MERAVLNDVMEKTKVLMEASSCSKEAKAAAQKWMEAIGTEREVEETRKYIEELEADVVPIDGLIGFAESDGGKKVFGAETAEKIAAHAREIKAAGAKYCDCPACAAALAILEKKAELFQ